MNIVRQVESGEEVGSYKAVRQHLTGFLPTPGNVLFTLVVAAVLLWVQISGAFTQGSLSPSSSTNTIAYQGRLADANGNPQNGTFNMTFRLYDVVSGGSALWTELWTGVDGVDVSDGLFNVLLGTITPIPQNVIENNDALWLSVKVGTDNEMTPRVQLGSAPYAVQAQSIASGAVESRDLALDYGTDCLNANASFSLPGSDTRVAVPGLSLNFTLAEAAQVLVWIDGNAGNNDDTQVGEGGVDLLVDGNIVGGQYERTEATTTWEPIATTRLVSLADGNHTITVAAFSQFAGTFNMAGTEPTWRTCINYLVLGEQ